MNREWRCLTSRSQSLLSCSIRRLTKLSSPPLSRSSHQLYRELLLNTSPHLAHLSLSYFPLYWDRALAAYPSTCGIRPLVAALVALFKVVDPSPSLPLPNAPVAHAPAPPESHPRGASGETAAPRALPGETAGETAAPRARVDSGALSEMCKKREGKLAIVASAIASLNRVTVDSRYLKLARLQAALIPVSPPVCGKKSWSVIMRRRPGLITASFSRTNPHTLANAPLPSPHTLANAPLPPPSRSMSVSRLSTGSLRASRCQFWPCQNASVL